MRYSRVGLVYVLNVPDGGSTLTAVGVDVVERRRGVDVDVPVPDGGEPLHELGAVPADRAVGLDEDEKDISAPDAREV